MGIRSSAGEGSVRLRQLRMPSTREAGSEQVEFALVVGMLLVLMLGIFWFARAYNIHQTMTRAVREGVRVAAMPSSFAQGNSFLDATTATKSQSAVFADYIAPVLRSASLDPEQVTGYAEQVTWLNPADANRQCGVVISFRYPFTFSIPLVGLNLSTIQLSAHAQMRRENQPGTGSCP